MNYITSYGATGEVTGSMHMIRFGDIGKTILLDCGAFQGGGAKEKNQWLPESINPMEIDYIFLSHAHLDHVGRLPILVQRGFEGGIICTPATKEITYRMLDDMLNIQREQIEDEGGDSSSLLFGPEDIEKVKRLFVQVGGDYPEWEDGSGLKVRFINAEHILGSASILIEKPISLLYTGDIGGGRSSLHGIPSPNIEGCDYLMIESTYGNRDLGKSDVLELQRCIEEMKKNRGRLLIPVLAIDRAEEILFLLRQLGIKENVYLDTPMGTDILSIYSHEKFLLTQVSERWSRGGSRNRGGDDFGEDKDEDFNKIFRPENFEIVRSKGRSRELANSSGSCIILASSGMLEGGRILGYLHSLLKEEKNIILFTSYQAEGSLGRMISDGIKDISFTTIEFGKKLKINCTVNCQIRKIEGLSAHADQSMLLEYIDKFKILPGKVFIIHGEKDSSSSLEKEIQKRFRIRTVISEYNVRYDLNECLIRDRVVVKDVSNINTLRTKFENIGCTLKAAPFAGWIIDNGGSYSLAYQEDIEKMLKDSLGIRNNIGDIEIGSSGIELRKEEVINNIPTPEEFVKLLFGLFGDGYTSKGLIKSLIDAVERGGSEYRKVIEKRIKGGDLIIDDIELGRKGITVSKEKREEIGNMLGDILKRASGMDMKTLHSSLITVREEIKDM